jgi:hypothetical protein
VTEHEPRDVQHTPPMAAEPDPPQLLTALTTEHFTLQGARSQTVSESASRASLYLFSVSSTLVALGFIGQISAVGDTFKVFALTALPTLYVLGLFTFVRLVQSVAEDFQIRAGDQPDQAPLSRARGRQSSPVHDVGSRRRARGARQHGNQAGRLAGLLHDSEHGRSDQQRRWRQRGRDCGRGDWRPAARGSPRPSAGWWRSSLWRRCAASRPATYGPGLVSSRSSSPRRNPRHHE